MRRLLAVTTLSVAVALSMAPPAFAYIDPGSGSYLLQLLVGTAVGIGAVLMFPIRKALGRLRRRKGAEDEGAAIQGSDQVVPHDREG